MEIYFGDVPGVKVGQCFKNRKELREAGIHAPLMAGIWGSQEGACSIVLSGGYEDDIDDLDLCSIFAIYFNILFRKITPPSCTLRFASI